MPTTTITTADRGVVEFSGALNGLGYFASNDGGSLVLSAPDDAALELELEFDDADDDGAWRLHLDHNGTQAPWPITLSTDDDGGPAIQITHPAGVTVTCSGEVADLRPAKARRRSIEGVSRPADAWPI